MNFSAPTRPCWLGSGAGSDGAYYGAVLIKSYGLFWRVDEVDWHPASHSLAADGLHRRALLGHRGEIRPRVRVADFWDQRGIYILYGNYGPHYVGITTTRGLGIRLKEHLEDRHRGDWDRFSWFGFRGVLDSRDTAGLTPLAAMTDVKTVRKPLMIREMEALIIYSMGLSNKTKTRFPDAHDGEWKQVLRLQREGLVTKLRPGRHPVQRRRRRPTPSE